MTRKRATALELCAFTLALTACGGTVRGPAAPVIIAGSVCSGVRGLDPHSLGVRPATATASRPGLVATLSPAEKDGGPLVLAVAELDTPKLRWKKSVEATSRPQILDQLVLVASGETLVAYDLASGAERFRTSLGRPLWLGAAQSGKTIVVTAGANAWDPRQRGSTLLALDADSGATRWRRDVPYALSAPVARAERALVVADHADLWALNLDTGADAGCGSLGGNTVEWLEGAADGLLFGASEARALGADATEHKPALELPRRDLPGRPFIHGSSYQPVPGERSAHGRVGTIAPLSTTTQGVALAGDNFYFVFYRDVFGFRRDGGLAWAQLVEADIARAEASQTALWVVTEAGVVLSLDAATGSVRAAQALGIRVASADIAPSSGTATVLPPTAAAPELQSSLRRVADDTDARLLPARMLAVDELAKLAAENASADLLAVYTAPNAPSALRDRIANRLRERTRGAEHLLAALEQHEDFIEERSGAPLRAIVPGLVTQHETRATPGLVAQLFDPDTPAADLEMLVSALDTLAGDAAREPLRKFFAMYRADSALAPEPDVLVAAARALVAREDAEGRALATAARDNAATPAALREQLATLLAPPPEAAPEVVAEAAPEPATPDAPPPTELRTLLEAARPQLAPCVSDAQTRNPRLNAVRLWFVADPNGTARDVRVTPIDERLASCLAGKLRELSFITRQKQLVSFQLAVQPAPGSAEAAAPAPGDDVFWALAEKRASNTAKRALPPPWWLDKNPLFIVIDEQPSTATAVAPANVPAAPASAPPASALTPAPANTPAPQKPAAQDAEDAWWLPTQNGKR